jgi:superkiller protein 3
LQQADRLEPHDSDQFFWLGATFYQLRQYPDALPVFQEALRLERTNGDYWHWLGETYMNGFGQYEKAVAAFVESRRLDPNDAKNHNELGLAYDHLQQYEKALAEFKEAARLKPAEPLYQSNLGIAYVRLDRKDEAQQIYRRLATMDKTKAQVLYDMINKPAARNFLYSSYNVQRLLLAYGRAYEFYDGIDTATNLPPAKREAQRALAEGDRLRRADKAEQAIEAYRRATHGSIYGPIDTPILARSYLGQALVFGKDSTQRTKAIQLLRQAVRFAPENSDAVLALALNYTFTLDWSNALAAVQQSIRMRPNDPSSRYWLGWVYFHGLSNDENALAAYEDALRLKPNDREALTDLGTLYLFLGQYPKAVTALREAIRLKADNTDGYWFLGLTYSQMGSKPQAQQIHRTLMRMDKDLAAEFAQRL